MSIVLTHPRTFTGLGSGLAFDPGATGAAISLKRTLVALVQDWTGSAIGQRQWGAPIQRLREIAARARTPGWDGDDALPVSVEAYREALQLICMLPSSVPVPDIYPEATGAICFEWYGGKPAHVLILALSGMGRIEYSVLNEDGSEGHGRAPFHGGLPRKIAQELASFLGL
jgi:hypothetical protein